MLRRKGKTARNNPKTRRGVILRFLLGLSEEEQRGFVDLILAPFALENAEEETTTDGDGAATTALATATATTATTTVATVVVPLTKQLGFLHLLGDFISNLGAHLANFLPDLLPVLLRILSGAQMLLLERARLQPRFVGPLRSIRKMAVRLLTNLYRSYGADYMLPHTEAVFRAAVVPGLQGFYDENVSRPGPLLVLFGVWAEEPRLRHLLSECDALPHVFDLLKRQDLSDTVAEAIFTLVSNLLGPESAVDTILKGEKEKTEAEREQEEEIRAREEAGSVMLGSA
eukprot:UC1_evm1s572